jgi:hypothetical protein
MFLHPLGEKGGLGGFDFDVVSRKNGKRKRWN